MSQVQIQWPSFLKSSIFGDCFHQICVDGRHKLKRTNLLYFQMKTDTSGWAKMIATCGQRYFLKWKKTFAFSNKNGYT